MSGRPIRACEAVRGWWVTTVRVLALVLALALVVPATVHAAEAHGSAGHELSLSAQADGAASDHADACPACHANCGCHQALSADAAPATPSRTTGRASYAVLIAAIGSVSPDRLPRPPRA